MKGQTYVILAIIFVIIVSVFAVTNVEAVEVNYLFWSGESPLILIILFSVLMGGIITFAVGAKRMVHLQREVKKMQADNDRMNKTLEKHGLLKEKPQNKTRTEIKQGKSTKENK
ncbi:putative integral membrane protein [Virgibacillus halotolerans]|uniref:LapA family protein n=1 Tax=Virgibacillus halotolerans TaxID=1071053 RepID=UPI0019609AF2|nr:lipopolysaccharide assembly protein LapA domain-containing protein [Virgibacillus halotolerans]MBM7597838.1 putative integral membrane protein [Virgibacillus halotolerans]